MIAANTVNLLRKSYSDVKCENIFITPYITESYKLRNELMKKRFDCILYPPIENTPYRFAIIRRNEWMVKNLTLFYATLRTLGAELQKCLNLQ